MKILIFAHALRAGGGRTTCINLLSALGRVNTTEDIHLIVPDQPEFKIPDIQKCGNVQYFSRRLGHLSRWYFDTIEMPRLIRKLSPDLVWSMGGLGLAEPKCKQAISIQYPYLFYDAKNSGRLSLTSRFKDYFFQRRFWRQLPRTQLIFCQTNSVAQRLQELGFMGRTIVTGKSFEPKQSANQSLNATSDLPKPDSEKFNFFYLTRYYPHKGLEILLDLFRKHSAELENVVLYITISAEQHKNARRFLQKIQHYDLESKIVNLGPLREDQFSYYYEACDGLLMPTRLESFSGTYLESMHFGLPILTSDLDFAHDVCGDAALYFDPWDTQSILMSIKKLETNEALRRRLILAGHERLKTKFSKSWESIVITILGELQSLGRVNFPAEGADYKL